MGNYRSRPRSTCSQELLNRILENYRLLEEKLEKDMNVDFEHLNEIQKICCNGTADQMASLLNSESLGERLDNGMTLMHLCCVAAAKAKGADLNEKKDDMEGNGNKYAKQASCILQLIKPRYKSDHNDKNQLMINGNIIDPEDIRPSLKEQYGKEQRDQIRLLLQKGADPAIISKNGFSPLHLASYKVKPVEHFWLPVLSA